MIARPAGLPPNALSRPSRPQTRARRPRRRAAARRTAPAPALAGDMPGTAGRAAAEPQDADEPVRLPVRDDVAARRRGDAGCPGLVKERLDALAGAAAAQIRPDLRIGKHLDDPLAVSVPRLAQYHPIRLDGSGRQGSFGACRNSIWRRTDARSLLCGPSTLITNSRGHAPQIRPGSCSRPVAIWPSPISRGTSGRPRARC